MKPPRALRTIIIAGALCLTVTLITAQEAERFEVVSVRRSQPVTAGTPTSRGSFLVLPDGRFEARGQTLATLAGVAFGFDQVDATKGVVQPGAAWMSTDRFDVIASAGRPWTVPPSGTKVPGELRTMLRAMLEDRFALQSRIGTHKMNVMTLRLAKPDALGPALRPSSSECRGTSTGPSPASSASPRCPPPDTTWGIKATAVTMVELADLASKGFPWAGQFVDQTGLPGLYDVSYSNPPSTADKRALTADALLGRLGDQLGMKLERTSLPVPALILDKARKPQED